MKNRLLTLEHKLCAPPGKPQKHRRKRRNRSPKQRHHRVRTQAQSFDWDEPIELTYNNESGSYMAEPSYAASAYDDDDYDVSAMGYEDDDDDDGPHAMDYGDDDDDYDGPHAMDYGDDDDDDDDDDGPHAMDYGDDDEGYDDDYDGPHAMGDDDYGEVEAFEVESFDDDEPYQAQQLSSVADLDEETLAEDLDFSDLDAASEETKADQAMSDRAFAADLQAILRGQKTYEQDPGGMSRADDDAHPSSMAAATESTSALPDDIREAVVQPHDVFDRMSSHMPHNQMDDLPLAQTKSQPVGAAEDEAVASPHDVFDRMGHNMSYANTYDFGTISLEQRFDEFDEAMARTQKRVDKAPRTMPSGRRTSSREDKRPMVLDETALEADLAQMHDLSKTEKDVDTEKTDEQTKKTESSQEIRDEGQEEFNETEHDTPTLPVEQSNP